ncbi:related to WD40-repeat protein (notchless protein) [Serendipita indica DSM 11827]|uniref:Related to WD40-repeat protein (Notchless protein) n=1 Tax=Serendipita indica (strain DSM 11827) TaxID=1109443 RepID=G4TJB8_SERID|nr:related to WD40-repeat protein (notchless protein) [Serendipita indica DSM 11827]
MPVQKTDIPKASHAPTGPSEPSSLTQGSASRRNQVYDMLSVGLGVAANVAEGSDVLAPLKAASLTTKSILEVMQSVESNQEDWTNLKRRLKDYMSVVEEQITLFETYPPADRVVDTAISQPLIRYVEYLEVMHDRVVNLQEKRKRSKLGFLKAISKVKIDSGEIRQFNQDIEDQHRQFMGALNLFTALRVQAMERNMAILQLPAVAFIASSVHTTCLQGTRKAVLEAISEWAEDDKSDKSIFWLCDIAGSGKSTVAMSAVEAWTEKGVLGGQFFFSISSSEGSTTEKFCSTIARDLANYIPELATHVAEAVKQTPSLMRASLSDQFQKLVVHPVRHRQRPIILVVDAVDECKSVSQRRELLEVLSAAVQESNNIKIFMTSRPDSVIEAVLGPLSIKAKLADRLHDVSHSDNIDDVAVYVHRSLDGVLPEDKRQRLVEKARGLFIWASTACRILKSETNLDTTEDIYNDLLSVDKMGDIDDVYHLVFRRVDSKSHQTMCRMLAVLLTAFEPLTVDELEGLLKHADARGSVKALMQNLGSVLIMDETINLIQFRHPTLIEYLRRCAIPPASNEDRIYLNVAEAHGQTVSWCFKCLESRTEGLKFNICRIESSFSLNREIQDLDAKVSKFIPRRLRYASSHWSFHFAETNDKWRNTLRSELQQMVQSPYVLYWIEILSLTGGVLRAIAGLRAITRHAGIEETTRSKIHDIRRFMTTFFIPIQDSAPHIYVSALPFTPKKSPIHIEGLKRFKNTLAVTQGVEPMYPGLPTMLRGHEHSVMTVKFSPDGSRIISGSLDKTIRMWDAETGQQLGKPFEGHEDWVLAVEFSPDGSQIVSGSRDQTVRVWDAATGHLLGEPLIGHEGEVSAIAISPDSSYIVSGSSDKTIRLWDAATGKSLGEPLVGHEYAVEAVAFSPDGLRVISGSDDGTIRLWDVDTRKPLGEPIEGHEDAVRAVAFSPDGLLIASGSKDNTIRLWDAKTGQPLGDPFEGHRSSVVAVAFSPDGSRIVSGSWDYTLRLWDVNTGQPLGRPFEGHEEGVYTVAFSPDGSRVISGSNDDTIRLWDAETGQPLGELLESEDDTVNAVQFSRDGSRIVSGSNDGMVRVWDAVTGQLLGEPLFGHLDHVLAVAFSPDGSRIASGGADKSIYLWNVATGDVEELIEGHISGVWAIEFSPDGSQIVSSSGDGTIRLWDAVTGQPLGRPLKGHESSVYAVSFSPDGSRLVSGSADQTIRLWNTKTGQPLGEPLEGHDDTVWAVEFSPNGSQIVSGSSDGTIRLWDAEARKPLGEPLKGHEGAVWDVGFSPDGSKIVSCAEDKGIQLWDATTGQPLGDFLIGHVGSVSAVAFSPDGSRILSGSADNTIRLWNIDTDVEAEESNADTSESNADTSESNADTSESNADTSESEDSGSSGDLGDAPVEIEVPGFEQCLLMPDGWVKSSGNILFWVPPDNRHGLQYQHILTLPTTSSFRATKIDFTRFQCGPSWTSVSVNK